VYERVENQKEFFPLKMFLVANAIRKEATKQKK
jgi:hypothetical protein